MAGIPLSVYHDAGKFGPRFNNADQVAIDLRVFCLDCCAWRCAILRTIVFHLICGFSVLTANPQVGGANPPGRGYLAMTYDKSIFANGKKRVRVVYLGDAALAITKRLMLEHPEGRGLAH